MLQRNSALIRQREAEQTIQFFLETDHTWLKTLKSNVWANPCCRNLALFSNLVNGRLPSDPSERFQLYLSEELLARAEDASKRSMPTSGSTAKTAQVLSYVNDTSYPASLASPFLDTAIFSDDQQLLHKLSINTPCFERMTRLTFDWIFAYPKSSGFSEKQLDRLWNQREKLTLLKTRFQTFVDDFCIAACRRNDQNRFTNARFDNLGFGFQEEDDDEEFDDYSGQEAPASERRITADIGLLRSRTCSVAAAADIGTFFSVLEKYKLAIVDHTLTDVKRQDISIAFGILLLILRNTPRRTELLNFYINSGIPTKDFFNRLSTLGSLAAFIKELPQLQHVYLAAKVLSMSQSQLSAVLKHPVLKTAIASKLITETRIAEQLFTEIQKVTECRQTSFQRRL